MAPRTESRSLGLGNILVIVLVVVLLVGAVLVRLVDDSGPPTALRPIDIAEEAEAADESSADRLAVGVTAPDFELADLDGNRVRLSDYAGRPVMINFWSTWCGPCEVEMPLIEKAYQAHQSDGLAVLAIAVDDNPDSVKRFFEERDLTFLPLLDDGTSSRAFQVFGLPTSYFIAADGKIAAVHMGLLTEDRIEGFLARAEKDSAQ